ncbi:MAG: major capsid protein, partial [Pseudomonadota bacterium]
SELNLVNPSLIDVLNRTDPQGAVTPIIEQLEQTNPILQHATYTECNDGTKHKTSIRTGIPEPAFRRYNQGVQPSKSQVVPITDTTGMIEDYNEVDAALANLNGNAKAFRMTESKAVMQGFNNFVNTQLFYGSTKVTPDGFMGLAPRFSELSGTANARQIKDAGGTGSNNASIWFITWSDMCCQLLYPKGSKVGFQHTDKTPGQPKTKDLLDGKKMEIYEDHYKWDIGMTMRDWRGIARICNIDISNLTKDASAGADLLDLLIDAEEELDMSVTTGGKTCIYVSRTVAKFLRKQALNKVNVELRVEEVAGKRVTMWGEYPVYRLDSLLETEAQVA